MTTKERQERGAALKREMNCCQAVLTFLLGARFFHETNLVRKGIALAAIVLGVALMCLFK